MRLKLMEWSDTLGACPAPDGDRAARAAGFLWTLLPRHGRRPARILGRDFLCADNRAACAAGRLPVWSDLRVHELYGGGFAVSIRHVDRADDRAIFQDVWHAGNAAAVVALLRAHDADASTAREGMEPSLSASWRRLLDAVFGSGAAP